jgi:hypothetical protein
VQLSVLARNGESFVFGGFLKAGDRTADVENPGNESENRDGPDSRAKREVIIMVTPEFIR